MKLNEAGGLVTTAIPTCRRTDIVGSVLAIVQNSISSFDSIDYIYVLEDKKLIGVLSIHELFSASPSEVVQDVMVQNPATVRIHTDRIHVAQLALAESIKAVPVVDSVGDFFGVVTADVIIQIFNDQHTNYLFRNTGIRRHQIKTYRELSFLEQFKTRSPWLVLGLFGGLIGAAVINFFEHSIADQLFVAAFIPAIVYIADAIGNQTEMLVVRALGRDKNFKLSSYIIRELLTGTLLSIFLGVIMFVLSFAWLRDGVFSLVLGTSIIATTLFCITFTVTLPWVLKRIGFDPAVASGPIATVVVDVSSVTIYLLIASHIL